MRFMHLTLLAALMTTAGCFIDASDERDTGRFGATWSVTQGGVESGCDETGIVSVSVLTTAERTGTGYDDLYLCTDLGGVTAPRPIDNYTVVESALDANDANLSASVPFTASLFACAHSDCVVDLPHVVFAVGN
jgi:hypothetical protein